MQLSDSSISLLLDCLPTVATIVVSGTVLWGCNWLLIGRCPELGVERKFPRQILMLFLMVGSILAVILSLPIDKSSRNQIIGLVGIFLSGIVAFSSTNIIANLMAGVLLRITKPFRTGDFIRVGEFFGRVCERGLFDTEIQSESRELIALPNTYLINNPVSTIRNSGAIVSATLSLGYDVHYLLVEPLLTEAAEKTGLKDPFVNILELGNFSVTYRISGLLTDVKGLITARSNLFRAVLDTLHNRNIEIMSPSFMAQRRVADDQKIIPHFIQGKPPAENLDAETIIFDKAEQAEETEGRKQELIDDINNLEIALKKSQKDSKDQIKTDLEKKRELLKDVEQSKPALNLDTGNVAPNES